MIFLGLSCDASFKRMKLLICDLGHPQVFHSKCSDLRDKNASKRFSFLRELRKINPEMNFKTNSKSIEKKEVQKKVSEHFLMCLSLYGVQGGKINRKTFPPEIMQFVLEEYEQLTFHYGAESSWEWILRFFNIFSPNFKQH